MFHKCCLAKWPGELNIVLPYYNAGMSLCLFDIFVDTPYMYIFCGH